MKQNLIYTGVGARATPGRILELMDVFAELVSSKGNWLLRSGGATGADSAFERGCSRVRGLQEIYLPWPGFEGSYSKRIIQEKEVSKILTYYVNNGIMTRSHINNMSPGQKKMHARNYYQIMGMDNTPTNLVVCWTPGGRVEGGTATAIKLARHKNILVRNLGLPEIEEEVREFIRKNK